MESIVCMFGLCIIILVSIFVSQPRCKEKMLWDMNEGWCSFGVAYKEGMSGILTLSVKEDPR